MLGNKRQYASLWDQRCLSLRSCPVTSVGFIKDNDQFLLVVMPFINLEVAARLGAVHFVAFMVFELVRVVSWAQVIGTAVLQCDIDITLALGK